MKIVGMSRVKNEARWISRVLAAALEVCDEIVILDDHSTDDTAGICRLMPRVTVLSSPFEGLDESRDKNWLLGQVELLKPEYVLHFDGDEELERADRIGEALTDRLMDAWTLQVLYLWDRPDQIRTDGVYGAFRRPSLFRFSPGLRFGGTAYGGNFHCGNVPGPVRSIGWCGARLLHYGYMERADRIRKYQFYNRVDPNSVDEDRYRHIVQGDVPEVPAAAKLKHAGPLTLTNLNQEKKGYAAS